LYAALRAVFPSGTIYPRELFPDGEDVDWSEEEAAIGRRSAEVVLQGLAEGLESRANLSSLYNQMVEVEFNPLHRLLATALSQGRVPAVFTTNQDRCIEDALVEIGNPLSPAYDDSAFAETQVGTNLYQFHGAIGGSTQAEIERRKKSLSFTLYSMGPLLPPNKRAVLESALDKFTLLFMGYSGSDPDVWYALYDYLQAHRNTQIYWCYWPKKSNHLQRLENQFPNQIVTFRGDMVEIHNDLALVWDLPGVGSASDLEPDDELKSSRLDRLNQWMPRPLSPAESNLVFGWLLVSVGLHKQSIAYLEKACREADSAYDHMMALLFLGYAHREVSEHVDAQRYLSEARDEAETLDSVRWTQAIHKLGESLSAFESVRAWYFWPYLPQLHTGTYWLTRAIDSYESTTQDLLMEKQLSRAGLGNAYMNLGQVYRRVAAFTPGLRPSLSRVAVNYLREADRILVKEGDMRSLSMVRAAIAADDQDIKHDKKMELLHRSIDIAENWSQDDIQIGSAYFAMAQFLASTGFKREELEESELYYLKALASFRRSEMNAEIVRTELDLAGLLNRQAQVEMDYSQSSSEWRLGMRVLGVMKAIRALIRKELAIGILMMLLVLAIVDYGAFLPLIFAALCASILLLVGVIVAKEISWVTKGLRKIQKSLD